VDRLNRWLTLSANFGVIAGIVFLGFEIQQNSDAINAQAYQSRTEAVLGLSTSTRSAGAWTLPSGPYRTS